MGTKEDILKLLKEEGKAVSQSYLCEKLSKKPNTVSMACKDLAKAGEIERERQKIQDPTTKARFQTMVWLPGENSSAEFSEVQNSEVQNSEVQQEEAFENDLDAVIVGMTTADQTIDYLRRENQSLESSLDQQRNYTTQLEQTLEMHKEELDRLNRVLVEKQVQIERLEEDLKTSEVQVAPMPMVDIFPNTDQVKAELRGRGYKKSHPACMPCVITGVLTAAKAVLQIQNGSV